ncbi:MAG: hypothetical protein WC389_22270 [Lutibacter sp.]|jgi:hypothetical protein
MNSEQKKFRDIVLEESEKGNIVINGIEGLMSMPIKEFVKQPIGGVFV